jgi:hypothetical protein
MNERMEKIKREKSLRQSVIIFHLVKIMHKIKPLILNLYQLPRHNNNKDKILAAFLLCNAEKVCCADREMCTYVELCKNQQ